MTTLLLSSRATDDNQALWRAALQLGWSVERVRGITLPEGLNDTEILLYVEPLLAPTIAEQLGLTLIEPPEDWLVTLPHEYRRRAIRLTTLGEARRLQSPMFVKPPNDKSFEASLYPSGAELPAEFDDGMRVLVGEPVTFEVEYRCFVLDRIIRAMSPYVRGEHLAKLSDFAFPEAEANEARTFAGTLLADRSVVVPKAVVLDVGRIADSGWAAVELNGAWGSGIYGCDPVEVLHVIRQAAIPSMPRL